jgi:hypothetical protein
VGASDDEFDSASFIILIMYPKREDMQGENRPCGIRIRNILYLIAFQAGIVAKCDNMERIKRLSRPKNPSAMHLLSADDVQIDSTVNGVL